MASRSTNFLPLPWIVAPKPRTTCAYLPPKGSNAHPRYVRLGSTPAFEPVKRATKPAQVRGARSGRSANTNRRGGASSAPPKDTSRYTSCVVVVDDDDDDDDDDARTRRAPRRRGRARRASRASADPAMLGRGGGAAGGGAAASMSRSARARRVSARRRGSESTRRRWRATINVSIDFPLVLPECPSFAASHFRAHAPSRASASSPAAMPKSHSHSPGGYSKYSNTPKKGPGSVDRASDSYSDDSEEGPTLFGSILRTIMAGSAVVAIAILVRVLPPPSPTLPGTRRPRPRPRRPRPPARDAAAGSPSRAGVSSRGRAPAREGAATRFSRAFARQPSLSSSRDRARDRRSRRRVHARARSASSRLPARPRATISPETPPSPPAPDRDRGR